MLLKKLGFMMMLVMLVVSCASTKESESMGEYVDNGAISAKIKSKLMTTKGISSTNIEVESFKNTVILSGFVSSEEEKKKAMDIAKMTEGVQEVKDALYLKSEI